MRNHGKMELIIVFRHLALLAIMATPLPAAEASLPPTPSTPDLQPPTNIMPAAQNDLMPPAQQDAMPPPQPDDDDLDPEDEQPTTSAEVAEMHAKLDAEEENDFKDWDTSDGDKLRVQLQAKEDDLAAEVENVSDTSLATPRFSATVERRRNAH
jgi:hypothetical protein